MLIERNDHKDNDGSVGYIESVFNSGNVLKTTYFPKTNMLYIAFNRGDVYSYNNIDEDMYREFEESESQGLFFHKRINKNKNHIHRKEYSLYPNEINEIKETIQNKLNESDDSED